MSVGNNDKTYQVRLVNQEKGLDTTITVGAKEYILDAAEQQGIEIPYSCRAGVCISCVGRMVEGKVNQDHDFLKQKELDAGFILTCKAYPVSNCVLLTHQEEPLLDL